MENYILMGALLWLLAAGYLLWRVLRSVKRRLPVPSELTWLIYLVVFTLFAPLISAAGHQSQKAGAAVLIAGFAVSFAVSYWALRRYRKWLEEQEKKEKEQ